MNELSPVIPWIAFGHLQSETRSQRAVGAQITAFDVEVPDADAPRSGCHSVVLLALAQFLFGFLALAEINGKHDATARYSRKQTTANKDRNGTPVSPHVNLLVRSTNTLCDRLLDGLFVQMQLIRAGEFLATQLMVVEFGTGNPGQFQIRIIGVGNESFEVPNSDRHHVAFVNASKLCLAIRERAFHLLALGNVDMADHYASMFLSHGID